MQLHKGGACYWSFKCFLGWVISFLSFFSVCCTSFFSVVHSSLEKKWFHCFASHGNKRKNERSFVETEGSAERRKEFVVTGEWSSQITADFFCLHFSDSRTRMFFVCKLYFVWSSTSFCDFGFFLSASRVTRRRKKLKTFSFTKRIFAIFKTFNKKRLLVNCFAACLALETFSLPSLVVMAVMYNYSWDQADIRQKLFSVTSFFEKLST